MDELNEMLVHQENIKDLENSMDFTDSQIKEIKNELFANLEKKCHEIIRKLICKKCLFRKCQKFEKSSRKLTLSPDIHPVLRQERYILQKRKDPPKPKARC